MTPLPDGARPRYRTVLLLCVAMAACAVLAAACGSTAAPAPSASGTSSGAGSASPVSAARISLDVSFAASPAAPGRHYTLRCDPAGGTAPDPAAACAKLVKGASVFAAQPAHVMCPMILASAGRAIVTGTYLGQKVHETIVDGGCQLAKYEKLKQVFN